MWFVYKQPHTNAGDLSTRGKQKVAKLNLTHFLIYFRSNNHLTELPESIGYLQNLEALSVAKNCLVSLPNTICYLSSLLELDVSYNQLESVTPYLGCLEKLKSLTLAVNKITQLPTEIRGLVNLISLDLSRNPLSVLPAEVAKLPFLRRIRCEDCPFDRNLEYTLKHNPPSLFELCARTSLMKNINLKNVSFLPPHIINYIKSAKICSSCHGPYFESFVLRGRLMEKSDVHIPLQYTLCSSHWSDADDRIISMFSTQPATPTESEILPYRPLLPTQSMEKLPFISRRSHHQSQASPLDNAVAYAPKLRNDSKSTLSKLSTTFKRPSIPW
jgi:Leucine-rich repeat (LRR) protein